MKSINILIVVAIIAVTFSVVNLIVQFDDVMELTGFAIGNDSGTANVTIIGQASIEFTASTIDWGLGAVNEVPTSALLVTNGTVDGGNWSAVSTGLLLRNDGNTNVSVTLTSTVANDFIGGLSAVNLYQLLVSDTGAGEANSCDSNHLIMDTFTEVNGAEQNACTNFSYYDAQDLIEIDVLLRIPEDATPGLKSATITASATPL